MYQNWKIANHKNYEFEYSISDVIPDSIIGKVTVLNGQGDVQLTVNDLTPSDNDYNAELKRYSKRQI